MRKRTKHIVFVILVLLILLFSFFKWASASTLSSDSYSKIIKSTIQPKIDNDSIIKIITYNVGYLSGMTNNKAVKRSEKLFVSNLIRLEEQLKKSNPDIIAFQEIDFDANRSYNVNQMNEVLSFGYPFGAQAVNWDERYLPFPYGMPNKHFGKVLSGQSVISKYSIVWHKRNVLQRVEDIPFYRDAFYLDRLAQIVKIEIQNKILVVINVHLEAYDKPTREAQSEAILNYFNSYRKQFPTILLGDFNSDPRNDNSIINRFLSLPNTGNAAYTTKDFKSTYSSLEPIDRIDYIFYSEDSITYIDGKVLEDYGDISDHLPVEMNFKLK